MGIRLRAHREKIEKQEGPLPSPGIIVPLGIPILILLTQVGEIKVELLLVRWIGLALSLYMLVMLPLIMRTLGRFAVPGAGIYRDHKLITSGPYNFVRHPLYSAAIALWLGTALGTINWLMLVLVPVIMIMVIRVPIQHEDALLRGKFGTEWEEYAEDTARIIPWI